MTREEFIKKLTDNGNMAISVNLKTMLYGLFDHFTLEFIVMNASPCDMPTQEKKPYQAPTPQYEPKHTDYQPKHQERQPLPQNILPEIDINEDEIPF